jgi:hypothetical protein
MPSPPAFANRREWHPKSRMYLAQPAVYAKFPKVAFPALGKALRKQGMK